MSAVWKMGRGKRSKAWLHFVKESVDKAKCSECVKCMSCKAGCTSNVAKHLRQHGINLKECTVLNVLRSLSANVSVSASTSQAPGLPLSVCLLETPSVCWRHYLPRKVPYQKRLIWWSVELIAYILQATSSSKLYYPQMVKLLLLFTVLLLGGIYERLDLILCQRLLLGLDLFD